MAARGNLRFGRRVSVVVLLVPLLGFRAPLARADEPHGDEPQAAEAPTTSATPDYVIGPADVLQIFVWKEPDLTRDVTVRFDGRVTLPLLGDLDAAGRVPRDLAADIQQKLSRFLSAPHVAVGVSQANSSRFYVIGQVNKPGDYPLTGHLTLVQALALAGGLKDFAKTENIMILRRKDGVETVISANYKKLESNRDITQDVPLRPADTIVIP
jgi:polysaccharide export outer membrane protein